MRFLEPMTAVMLANHRRVPPFGVAGGAPGALGRNWVERADGTREEFGATFAVQMNAGDVFVIQTPGGGGFGPPATLPWVRLQPGTMRKPPDRRPHARNDCRSGFGDTLGHAPARAQRAPGA